MIANFYLVDCTIGNSCIAILDDSKPYLQILWLQIAIVQIVL